MKHGQTILITGGQGYLGGRLAHRLASALPTASLVLATRQHRRPGWTLGMELRSMELETPESLAPCLTGVDTIVHLAALNERACMASPLNALRINTEGTLHLVQAAHQAGVQRFIYFSTFHVYGLGPGARITETSPTRPWHPYATTHRAAEDIVAFAQRQYGMQTLVLRLSNAFGAPMDLEADCWHLVLNDLCRQAAAGTPLRLTSSGTQHRDFISLRDVCNAVVHFLQDTTRWGDGLYNLGSGQSLSILQAAEKVAEATVRSLGLPRPPVLANVAAGDSAAPQPPVDYATDKLQAAGFSLSGDMDAELDALLRRLAKESPTP